MYNHMKYMIISPYIFTNYFTVYQYFLLSLNGQDHRNHYRSLLYLIVKLSLDELLFREDLNKQGADIEKKKHSKL